MRIKLECKICHKIFYVKESRKNKAKYCSSKCYGISKIGKKIYYCRGKNNWQWKNDNELKYSSLHDWIRAKKGRAGDKKCLHCGKQAMDWANVDGKYRRRLKDFISLCRSCHIKYDKEYNIKMKKK